MSLQQAPTVADQVKQVERDLRRRRLMAVIKIGVKRRLTLGELVEELPAEEKELLASVLGPIPSSTLYDWLRGPGEQHLENALAAHERAPEPSKANGVRRSGTNGQPRLPGIDSRTKPETITFDKGFVRLVAQFDDGARAGELKRQLGCSRGKLRWALQRTKTNGWIRQEGKLGGARYFATDAGLKFADQPPSQPSTSKENETP